MTINLLIVGAGAYVCGVGDGEFGTVLPAALGLQKEGRIGLIRIAASRPASVQACRAKLVQLCELLGHEPQVEFYPQADNRDPEAYLSALRDFPTPCAAIVVVPDSLHHQIAGSLVDRGVHCLVVKPLATTLAEAADLVRRSRARGVVAQVEFHKRFDDANRLLRREIQRGSLGSISTILVEYSQRRSQPLEAFRSWAHESHPFQYLGVHYVDLIQFVTGANPRRAMAVGTRSLLSSHGIETFDAVQAVIEWEAAGGESFTSLFATSWIDPESTTAMSNQILKVLGTKGRFDSDQKNRGVELTTERGHEAVNPYFSQLLPYGEHLRLDGYGPRSIATFIEDVSAQLAGTSSCSDAATFEEALISTSVCEAVTKSLRDRGAWYSVQCGERRSAPVAPARVQTHFATP